MESVPVRLSTRTPGPRFRPLPGPRHTEVMSNRRPLPDLVRDLPTMFKLIWVHLEHAPGDVNVETFASELGLSLPKTSTAINYMVELGMIIDLGVSTPVPSVRGRKIHKYRVASVEELRQAKPYQPLRDRGVT